MHRRLYRLITVLLLAVLPLQAFAGARMISCDDAAATAVSAAAEPCHAASTHEHRGAGSADTDGGVARDLCNSCAQCQVCSASALPVTVRSAVQVVPVSPAFPPPPAIIGVVLERLDRPPVA
jgi:hypothetical protein